METFQITLEGSTELLDLHVFVAKSLNEEQDLHFSFSTDLKVNDGTEQLIITAPKVEDLYKLGICAGSYLMIALPEASNFVSKIKNGSNG